MTEKAYAIGPGDGETVWSLGGRFTSKLRGADVEEHFSLTESLAFQTTEPPLHVHHHEHEA